ncbi:MAG TPA: GspE/PulE family protein [Gaiellaceae bacterium]
MEAAELPAFPAPERRLHLGALLAREGLLTPTQLERAVLEQEQNGARLGEIVVRNGWVSSRDLARLLAEQHGLEFLDLARTEIDPDAGRLLPQKLAHRYHALPISFLDESTIMVAIADPTDVFASDDLRLALGLNIRLAVVEPGDLEQAIARLHRSEVEISEDAPEELSPSPVQDILEEAATSTPAINLVNSIISRSIDDGASDIHFEPQARGLLVRARIDGVMRKVTEIPPSLQAAAMSRLKIMGELDIAEKRAPQDGRVSIRFGGKPMDLRIAVLPTTHGEQAVLRILQRASGRLGLAQLGMSGEDEDAFEQAIRQPYGGVIAVGPTGSGKTTTLYAALDLLNRDERVVTTIEDPVEWQIPGVNQIEVNARSGLTFARGLRTILRSDPDVLLVGEVRDEETARIAMQAAMTGHLVLTTLHAHNAASSIARLRDMGVDPGLLATSLNCIVAQRLARRLCPDCREPYAASNAERVEVGVADMPEAISLYRAQGCLRCAGTGYRGRVALYEVMPISGEVRRRLGSSTEEIFAAAVEGGMTTLRQDGLRVCLAGISSLEEIRRVTGDRLA